MTDYRILVVHPHARFAAAELPPVVYARDVATAISVLDKQPFNQVWIDEHVDDVDGLVDWLLSEGPKIGCISVQTSDVLRVQPIRERLGSRYPVHVINHPDLR